MGMAGDAELIVGRDGWTLRHRTDLDLSHVRGRQERWRHAVPGRPRLRTRSVKEKEEFRRDIEDVRGRFPFSKPPYAAPCKSAIWRIQLGSGFQLVKIWTTNLRSPASMSELRLASHPSRVFIEGGSSNHAERSSGQTEVVHHSGPASGPAATVDWSALACIHQRATGASHPSLSTAGEGHAYERPRSATRKRGRQCHPSSQNLQLYVRSSVAKAALFSTRP